MKRHMKRMAGLWLAAALAAPAFGQGIDEDLAKEGERVFRQCQACHQVGEGAQSRVGPHLNDVIGRTAGSLEEFRYSAAMTEAGEGGLVWNEEVLDEYLENPRGHVPGTSMAFAGLRQPEQRQAVIELLKSHSSGNE